MLLLLGKGIIVPNGCLIFSDFKHAVKQDRNVEKKPEHSDADDFPVS
jgi:hypothetical protein